MSDEVALPCASIHCPSEMLRMKLIKDFLTGASPLGYPSPIGGGVGFEPTYASSEK